MPVFMYRLFHMRPAKPRNPLVRLALGMIGVLLLAVLVVFGLFIGLGMLLFAAVRRMLRPAQPTPAAAEGTIEGEYRVVEKRQPSLHLH
jgi:hypothetical protein